MEVADAEGREGVRDRVNAGGQQGVEDSEPRTRSGGQQQRVAIARALAHRPTLVLADEPTGNLDPETAERVMALLGQQVREMQASCVLVTHSQAAARAADRVLQLRADGIGPA